MFLWHGLPGTSIGICGSLMIIINTTYFLNFEKRFTVDFTKNKGCVGCGTSRSIKYLVCKHEESLSSFLRTHI